MGPTGSSSGGWSVTGDKEDSEFPGSSGFSEGLGCAGFTFSSDDWACFAGYAVLSEGWGCTGPTANSGSWRWGWGLAALNFGTGMGWALATHTLDAIIGAGCSVSGETLKTIAPAVQAKLHCYRWSNSLSSGLHIKLSLGRTSSGA